MSLGHFLCGLIAVCASLFGSAARAEVFQVRPTETLVIGFRFSSPDVESDILFFSGGSASSFDGVLTQKLFDGTELLLETSSRQAGDTYQAPQLIWYYNPDGLPVLITPITSLHATTHVIDMDSIRNGTIEGRIEITVQSGVLTVDTSRIYVVRAPCSVDPRDPHCGTTRTTYATISEIALRRMGLAVSVSIDVLPGVYPNVLPSSGSFLIPRLPRIYTDASGTSRIISPREMPFAILSTRDFHAPNEIFQNLMGVKTSTREGPVPIVLQPVSCWPAHMNNDHRLDLLCSIPYDNWDRFTSDTWIEIVGSATGGRAFTGRDRIVVKP